MATTRILIQVCTGNSQVSRVSRIGTCPKRDETRSLTPLVRHLRSLHQEWFPPLGLLLASANGSDGASVRTPRTLLARNTNAPTSAQEDVIFVDLQKEEEEDHLHHHTTISRIHTTMTYRVTIRLWTHSFTATHLLVQNCWIIHQLLREQMNIIQLGGAN